MESFLEDYIDYEYRRSSEQVKTHVRDCYKKLIILGDCGMFNSVVLVKKYKGELYREDISIIYRLYEMSYNDNISDEDINYLYKNDYLTYDEFVAKYDNYINERDLSNFALYLIDNLRPIPGGINFRLIIEFL